MTPARDPRWWRGRGAVGSHGTPSTQAVHTPLKFLVFTFKTLCASQSHTWGPSLTHQDQRVFEERKEHFSSEGQTVQTKGPTVGPRNAEVKLTLFDPIRMCAHEIDVNPISQMRTLRLGG